MSLLARMERILRNRIGAKKELGEKYDFMALKSQVLFEHRGDICDQEQRKEYSSELSRRFGHEGGKVRKAKKNMGISSKEQPEKLFENDQFQRHMEALS